jgi:FtsZ-binding cell division protein ZapB
MDAATELSHHLWSLRQLLERLIYRLDVQQLLLAASRTRFLPLAAAEVDEASAAIAALDEHIRKAASDLAESVDLPPTAVLAELAEHTEPHVRQLLLDHRSALQILQSEVEELVRSNKELARRVISARDMLSALNSTTDTYTPKGTHEQQARTARRFDATA